jgi:two-component system, NtrC family, sensor kinase
VPGRGTVVGRVLLAGKPVQMPDVEADPEYTFTEGQKAGGFAPFLEFRLSAKAKPLESSY